MKFYNKLYPESYLFLKSGVVKFNKGVYETNNIDTINELKQLGYHSDYIDITSELKNLENLSTRSVTTENAVSTLPDIGNKLGGTFKVPVRWTMEKIMAFAKDNDIKLPDKIKKADAIKIIETSMTK